MDRGDLFVVSAPSGAGKSTLCDRLISRLSDIVFSVSHTTRPPRRGEVNGKDYFFVTSEEFERLAAQGAFLEWARVHGHFYGTSEKYVMELISRGTDVILDIDVQGASQVREKFPGAVAIFILPPSWKILEERLLRRGSEDMDTVRTRLRNALGEIEEVTAYEYTIVNDRLEDATDQFVSIVAAARCRTPRVLAAGIDMAMLHPDADSWFLK
jgi:guanylate kinase